MSPLTQTTVSGKTWPLHSPSSAATEPLLLFRVILLPLRSPDAADDLAHKLARVPGVLLVVEARDDGRPLRPPLPLRLRPHRLVKPRDRGVPVVGGGVSGRRTAGKNLG